MADDKREKLRGAYGWAVRGAKWGSIYVNESGYIEIAARRKSLLRDGVNPTHIVRVKISGVKKK